MPNTITPNMSLIVPTVGTEPGPTYATDINTSLTLIDQHNHTTGFGVQVPSAGLNINNTLSFNNNLLTGLFASQYTVQASPISAAIYPTALYVSGVDLYYNDGNNNQVRITQSGGVVGTPGSISGLTAPASATYIPLSATFQWQSAVNTPANMDMGSIIIRQVTSGPPNGITIASPNSLAGAYTLTLPSTLPTAEAAIGVDSSGNMSTTLGGIVPIGVILPFGGSSAPSGYFLCDGSAKSRSTFSALFAVIGTAFGVGDGSTTFNLPNMARNVPMGAGGSGTGTIGNAVGNTGGEENHVLSVGELADHGHLAIYYSASGSFGTIQGYTTAGTPNGGTNVSNSGSSSGAAQTAANTGSNTGHNTIQPSVIVNYIIKF